MHIRSLSGFPVRTFLVVFAAVFVCSSFANAQGGADFMLGFQPYYQYDFFEVGNINTVNGMINMDIPLISYQQRGTLPPLRLSASYSGSRWQRYSDGNGGLYWAPTYAIGGFGVSIMLLPRLNLRTIHTDLHTPPVDYAYQAGDFSGANHIMGWISPTVMESVDGSGIRWSGGDLTDRNGITFCGGGGVANCIMKDAQGNSVMPSPQGNADIDSVGRTIGGIGYSLIQPGCTTSSLPGLNGGTVSFVACVATVNIATTFPGTGVKQFTGTTNRLVSITLPNNRQWSFRYNNYGDVGSIDTPTGGTISFSYTLATTPGPGAYYWAVSGRSANANDGSPISTWTYSGLSTPNVIVTDPASNDTVYTYDVGSHGEFKSTKIDHYNGSRSNSSNLVMTEFTQNLNSAQDPFWYFDGNSGVYSTLPIVKTTTWAGGKTSQTCLLYDDFQNGPCAGTYSPSGAQFIDNNPDGGGKSYPFTYGSLVQRSEYDYGSGVAGVLVRQTNSQYVWQNNSGYQSANLLNLVSSSATLDGGGNQVAQTTGGYDENNGSPQGVYGNQTSATRWLKNGTSPISSVVFNMQGMPVKKTDANVNSTNLTYDATGLFLNQIQYPDTASGGATVHHYEYPAYDLNTGLLLSNTDENGQKTSYGYDPMNRVTSVTYPTTGGSATFSYTDSTPNPSFVYTRTISSSQNYVKTGIGDGFGRPVETKLTSDPDGTTYTFKTYDVLGRLGTVYNPTRCNPPTTKCNAETTWGYTAYTYDALGRVTTETEPDGSSLTTDYSIFPCTTVTDEAGKSRKSCVDGLGRLTGVWEDPAGLNYETDYFYDALNNLVCVEQQGGVSTPGGTGCAYSSSGDSTSPWRIRRFQYDSLSRITSATNPESGTTRYIYDANGNLAQKTLPKPNQTNPATTTNTNFCYDALNRVTSKAYSSTACPPSPSVATYTYDQGTNGIGHRTGMTDTPGSSSWTYDLMGRIVSEARISAGVTKTTSYVYNLDGSVKSITYPSTHTVNYTYSAAGRALSAIDPTGPINYATSATYAPPGELATVTNGFVQGVFAGINTVNVFSNRLQPVLLSAANPTATVLSLCYDSHSHTALNFPLCNFSASTAGDNGNVYQIVNNRDGNRTQNFVYDNLNRILQGYTSGTNWGEDFTIDGWGNLTNRSLHAGKTNYEPLNAAPAFTSNRLTGFGYDAAGNITSNGTIGYNYDQENRLTKFVGNTTDIYIYDGDGQRVKKSVPAVTLYWYGATGDVLDETSGTGTLISEYIFFNGRRVARRDADNTVKYYFADNLGSASVITNATGAMPPLEESDYYPYGGEIPITNGDPNHYKFTGKERDSESGLDMFGARYYGSSMGRFMTPDWSSVATAVPYADFGNPQSLNLYAYVRNNPLSRSDPDGHCDVDVGGGKTEHHWGWCIFHTLGFYLTKPEQQAAHQEQVEMMRKLLTKNGVYLNHNGKLIPPSEFSDSQVFGVTEMYFEQILSGQGIKTVKPDLAAAMAAARLTAVQARDLARYLGFREVKVDWDTHGQPVFEKNGRYISPDADGHSGGTWKEFDRGGNRIATLDHFLNPIGK